MNTNINFIEYTTEELKEFVSNIDKIIKKREEEEKNSLLINIIKALYEFDKKFKFEDIACFDCADYNAADIAGEIKRHNNIYNV
jgi:hypothetical protein